MQGFGCLLVPDNSCCLLSVRPIGLIDRALLVMASRREAGNRVAA